MGAALLPDKLTSQWWRAKNDKANGLSLKKKGVYAAIILCYCRKTGNAN